MVVVNASTAALVAPARLMSALCSLAVPLSMLAAPTSAAFSRSAVMAAA